MAGTLVINKVQLGDNGTAANNFLLASDGAGNLKIQRGNDGGSLTDVLTIDSAGKITSAFDIAAGQLSLTTNGYSKLANGLIIQWVSTTVAAGSNVDNQASIAWPIVFPTAILKSIPVTNKVSVSGGSSFPARDGDTPSSTTTARATVYNGASAQNITVAWIALGY